jgi:hypothetical protein
LAIFRFRRFVWTVIAYSKLLQYRLNSVCYSTLTLLLHFTLAVHCSSLTSLLDVRGSGSCRWSSDEDDRRKKMKQGRRWSNGADGIVATSWLVVQGSVIRLALPNRSLWLCGTKLLHNSVPVGQPGTEMSEDTLHYTYIFYGVHRGSGAGVNQSYGVVWHPCAPL